MATSQNGPENKPSSGTNQIPVKPKVTEQEYQDGEELTDGSDSSIAESEADLSGKSTIAPAKRDDGMNYGKGMKVPPPWLND